jgi:hypothetical protein
MKIMKSEIFRLALILCVFCVLASNVVATERFQVTTRSDHPIGDVCRALEAQFHWRISYEEAPVFAQEDVQTGTAPNGVPWLVLRDVPAVVDVPIESGMSADAKGKTLQSILDGHKRGGSRAGFTIGQNGDLIHVMATSVRGRDGKMEHFEPLLDTRISLPRDRYALETLVSMVLTQVSQVRGMSIALATVPTNLFAQSIVTEEANNEVARDVLVRAFEEINGARYARNLRPVRLTWYMNYEPNGGTYFFNVHNVEPETQRGGVPLP